MIKHRVWFHLATSHSPPIPVLKLLVGRAVGYSSDDQTCSPGLHFTGVSRGNFGDGNIGERALGAQREHFASTTFCPAQHIWQDILFTLVFSEFLLQVFCPRTNLPTSTPLELNRGKTIHSTQVSKEGKGTQVALS